MKRSSTLGFTALVTVLTAVAAPRVVYSQGATATPETPAARVAALVTEHDQAHKAFMALYREAQTDEDRQRIFEKSYPDPSTYAPRFLALAREFPGDEAAATAVGWIVSVAGEGPELAPALDLLQEHHLEREALATTCQDLVRVASPRVEAFLRTVLEQSPHASVRGQACFALALSLTRNDADRPEAERLLERVIAEFGALEHWRGDLGTAAQGELFELRFLAIGQVAPEIEGTDIDGVPFKLSDYRGKVVFLDFWGNW